jgi:hypothetical protein
MPTLLLLIAVALAFTVGGSPLAVIAMVIMAAAAGTTLPDLDMALGLRHRSAVLHSVLPIAVAAYDRRTWPIAAGLGLGLGLHLAADLFPNSMRGFATIKVPLYGSIGAGTSYLWIAAAAVGNLAAGAWLLGRIAERHVAASILAAVGVLGITYLLRTDGGWWALMMFAGIGWLALR